MRPAYSVIFFTVASGAGYGMLALLGLLAPSAVVPPGPWFPAAAFALALGLVSFGLVSSAFHLGRPERALKAYSQWRTSWLSREGVLATAAYLPALVLASGWIFGDRQAPAVRAAGLATALLSGLTVYATGMIYATLRPVPAWHNRWVVPNYLALALLTGALWVNALVVLFGRPSPDAAMVVVVATFLAFYLKRRYWRFIDAAPGPATPESATGLGGLGRVRLLDPTPDRTTFVTQEMVYRIARKHARKLRRWAFLLLFAAPLAATFAAAELEGAPLLAGAAALLGAAGASAGAVIERWLFFAEARHVAGLYHGAEAG